MTNETDDSSISGDEPHNAGHSFGDAPVEHAQEGTSNSPNGRSSGLDAAAILASLGGASPQPGDGLEPEDGEPVPAVPAAYDPAYNVPLPLVPPVPAVVSVAGTVLGDNDTVLDDNDTVLDDTDPGLDEQPLGTPPSL